MHVGVVVVCACGGGSCSFEVVVVQWMVVAKIRQNIEMQQ